MRLTGGHSREALAHVGAVLDWRETVTFVGFADALVLRLDRSGVDTLNLFATIVALRRTLHHHLRHVLYFSDVLDIEGTAGTLILPVESLLWWICSTITTLFQLNLEFQLVAARRESLAVRMLLLGELVDFRLVEAVHWVQRLKSTLLRVLASLKLVWALTHVLLGRYLCRQALRLENGTYLDEALVGDRGQPITIIGFRRDQGAFSEAQIGVGLGVALELFNLASSVRLRAAASHLNQSIANDRVVRDSN